MAKSKTSPEILLVSKEPQLLADVREAFGTAKVKVDLTTDAAHGATAVFVLLDHRGMPDAELGALLQAHGERVILLTEQDDKENINLLLALHPICHIIGLNGRAYLRELVITVQKYLTGDVWGLAKYFDSMEHVETKVIASADNIDETIETMLGHADMKTSFSATHEFLRMTANELVTNAVYNAPIDEKGQPKYEQTDRKIKVKLLDQETVTLSVCWDENYIGISVSDQFGRLDRAKIVRHLVKCVNNTAFIENKKGGAGAGIYLAFYTANQFVVNIEPGKRLEAICILEKNKRYKEYRQRVTSFNYFMTTKVVAKKIGGAA